MSKRDRPGSVTRIGGVSTLPHGFRELRAELRNRFLWGLPWGTLVVGTVLVFVYLVVQNAAGRWTEPLVIPFTSWSYSHPLGVFLGPLSHIGPEHLLDNLLGVLVFGSVVEYIYDHKRVVGSRDDDKRERNTRDDDTDEAETRTESDWTNRIHTRPSVRALVLFPAGAVLAGFLASLFSWGPTIGFSNVVYAFAGFALVRFPLGTVVVVSVREALGVVSRALDQPFLATSVSSASEPWFVDTAVQGHIFGLLLGVAAAVITLSARDETLPSPVRLWAGLVLFGLVQSLWLVWWSRGTGYVLARGLGVLVVLCLATVVVCGFVLAVGNVRQGDTVGSPHVGIVILLVPLSLMAGIAIPINATADVTTPTGAETVDVHGYEVTYVDEARNQRLAPFAAVTDTEPPTTSGVLVVDSDRGVWTRAVDSSTLEASGTATIRLGGLGWERTVFAVRRSWQAVGGEVTSQVWLNPRDGGFHRVYSSQPARATAVVAGYTLSLLPDGIRFKLEVSRDNETVRTATVPNRGQSVTVGTLEIRREGETLVAVTNQSRVPIAWRG